ncbi:MAG: hypothetical protein ACRDJN_13570 [Chloroflexota bacterium]
MARFLVAELPRVVVRLAAALAVYGLIGYVPWPPGLAHWIGVSAFAALAATILLICGKLLYDTLFYDHYWRQIDSR